MPEPLSDSDFDALDPRFRWMRDYLRGIAPPGRLAGRQQVHPPVSRPPRAGIPNILSPNVNPGVRKTYMRYWAKEGWFG